MKKGINRPDAATGTTTAKQNENERKCVENGVKITNSIRVFIPGYPLGKKFYINEKSVIYVQDVSEQQNSTLFEQGINLIDSKVSPKRRSYLAKLFRVVLPTVDMDIDDIMEKSCKQNTGRIIAFVCDIALHNNKKLAHPQAYHKDFNKYVANLFQEYELDAGFEQYVQLGAGDLAPIPIFMLNPEMYDWVSAIA